LKEDRREDEEDDVSSCWMTLRKGETLEFGRGSTRTHPVENWLWKRLWACRKTDYAMNESVS
jgi:hypothetical protein